MCLCKLNKVFANRDSWMPKVSMFLLKHEDEEAKMPFNVASYKCKEIWNISSFGKLRLSSSFGPKALSLNALVHLP